MTATTGPGDLRLRRPARPVPVLERRARLPAAAPAARLRLLGRVRRDAAAPPAQHGLGQRGPRRRRPAAVLPAGARGQGGQEPAPRRRPRRPRAPGRGADGRAGGGGRAAGRARRDPGGAVTSPARRWAPATSSCRTPRATSSASTDVPRPPRPARRRDGRFVVVDGRRWRATDPAIPGAARRAAAGPDGLAPRGAAGRAAPTPRPRPAPASRPPRSPSASGARRGGSRTTTSAGAAGRRSASE